MWITEVLDPKAAYYLVSSTITDDSCKSSTHFQNLGLLDLIAPLSKMSSPVFLSNSYTNTPLDDGWSSSE